MTEKFLLTPTPHAEAMEFIRSKPALAARIFGELLPELRARAFTIAGVEHFDTIQRVRELVAEVPGGADWERQKRQIVDEIAPSFAGKRSGYDPDGNPLYMTKDDARRHAETRAELLLRMHGFQAYAAASYRTMDAQRDVFPYWQYQSMGDQKVRDTHAALDGKVLPADSDFWKNHFPPWEWGCRCQVVPMTEDEVDDMRRAEMHKPLESRDVLDGLARAKVEQERKLVLGPNQIFDLRTQREQGKSDGYEWSPGELRIPLETLRDRYDSEVWAKFEAWAQTTGIPETGATVWEWLGGKALTPSGKLAKSTALAKAARFSDLRASLAAISASPWTREEKARKFHAALELPGPLRSSIGYRNSKVEPNVDEGFSFVRRMTAATVLDGPPVLVMHRRYRAAADPRGGFIDGKSMRVATVIHEMGHIVEGRNPAALARSVAFRSSRTAGEIPRWLGPGYGRQEVALEDQWEELGGRLYSGKVYLNRRTGADFATEILSIGLQRLYENPAEFFLNDPEYFAFVVDSLRGYAPSA